MQCISLDENMTTVSLLSIIFIYSVIYLYCAILAQCYDVLCYISVLEQDRMKRSALLCPNVQCEFGQDLTI